MVQKTALKSTAAEAATTTACGGVVLSQMIWPYSAGRMAADNNSPGRRKRSQTIWSATGAPDQSTNTQQMPTTSDRNAAKAHARGMVMGLSI